MTVEKVELVLEYFAHNDVDDNIPIWAALSPRQYTNLFGQEEYINIDYATGKPMATGRPFKRWMGINWVKSNKIVLGSSNDVDGDVDVYRCPFWTQDAIILGIQKDVLVRISELPTVSYSQQVYVYMNMGAMRMDEDKVCYVECQA
jgi:hypothetical protein